ncbi:helix-turn-helix transcriptional regulator [Paenibacillus sp. NPDC056579]|uniref:helix-turn-helix transcriptional regulator n=1 Tax=unclassified Paenibacillus TaxID=185978 RepID=UPI001EF815B1|nr:AraC family transcriptional regulator [Paenibacillus sp. H1-7]ULL16364.1 AraC family transcriptional regulator [Paenibacillus sp. H1-7]
MESILMDIPKTLPWIDDAKKYIDDHLTDPNLSLKQISHHFSMNPVQFSRMFKEGAGEKFIDYVTRLRIELSMKKLAMSSDSIQEIAWQVGYTHVVSFIRAFKKSTELTPGHFRKDSREAGSI